MERYPSTDMGAEAMIRSLAHVALQVTDLEGSLRHASDILGMRVVERVDGRAYLTLGSQHNTYRREPIRFAASSVHVDGDPSSGYRLVVT